MKSNYSKGTLVRVGLNLLLFSTLAFAWYHARTPKQAPAFAESPLDLPVIEKVYRYYNQEYFESKLPNIRAAWIGDDKYRALTVVERGKHSFSIRFNPKYNRSENDAQMHLLHEMCHVYLYENGDTNGGATHQQSFQDCMHGLAAKGAFDEIW